ncbi:MAG: hypothetical protein U1E77_21730 [Inhella sp.]
MKDLEVGLSVRNVDDAEAPDADRIAYLQGFKLRVSQPVGGVLSDVCEVQVLVIAGSS